MKIIHRISLGIFCIIASFSATADLNRDCLLEGTVQKNSNDEVRVKIERVRKYSTDTQCRIRRDRKLKFKLPDDPRVKDATPGSEVHYRYRTDGSGSTSTELVKIAT